MKKQTKLKTVLISEALDIEIKNHILQSIEYETFSHLVRKLLQRELNKNVVSK